MSLAPLMESNVEDVFIKRHLWMTHICDWLNWETFIFYSPLNKLIDYLTKVVPLVVLF